MHKILSIFAGAALIAISLPATAQKRTCSDIKAECDTNVAKRGQQAISQCPAAFEGCMKTGVWQTRGANGRTIKGVTRQ